MARSTSRLRTHEDKCCDKANGFLLAACNSDGGWPYVPGNRSAVEPTCYAAMAVAMRCGREDPVCRRAAEWLRTHASVAADEPQWNRSLALLALSVLDAFPDVRGRIANELLRSGGKQMRRSDVNELDSTLRGWPWVGGTFSWVEPTSYALIALKRSGHRDDERVHEGERLLLDRTCEDGGWNYGNRKVRGQALPSMMPTTALATIALQGAAAAKRSIDTSIALLDREVRAHPSCLSLALATLCFETFGRPTSEGAGRLEERQGADGSWRGQVHISALSVLALHAARSGENDFRI